MRYALGIEYEGKNYYGWQKQKSVVSVQETLEKALSKIADHPVEVICAGRTDTGVNATHQVVHFNTDKIRKGVAWTLGVNTYLPKDIAVVWVKEVDEDFHARFTATARRYRYIINNTPLRSAIMHNGLSHCHYPLNADLMHQAAQTLIGRHDFTSFRTVHCQSKSACRTIIHCNVSRQGDFIIIDIKANAFLHHMVRNIAGSLMVIGQALEPVSWMKDVLEAKNRCVAGITAPSAGLYFVDVDYPDKYALPPSKLGPLLF